MFLPPILKAHLKPLSPTCLSPLPQPQFLAAKPLSAWVPETQDLADPHEL